MRFLEKIDLIHESNRKNLNIPKENREFTSHIPITISVGEVSYGFEIRKKEKSKLLLSSGKQRIYLSDFDIINIILNRDICYAGFSKLHNIIVFEFHYSVFIKMFFWH